MAGAPDFLFIKPTEGLVARPFPGWESALNQHSSFFHFPVALCLTGLLFEVVAVSRRNDSIHRASLWLLWFDKESLCTQLGEGGRGSEAVPQAISIGEVTLNQGYSVTVKTPVATSVAAQIRSRLSHARRSIPTPSFSNTSTAIIAVTTR